MSDAIPTQHPAVVLRSNYQHLRALLAVAMIAVVGLTAAVVILATHNGGGTTSARVSSPAAVASPALPASSQVGATLDHRGLHAAPGLTTRYDGGPEEGTRGAFAAASPQSANPYSYNGGHEEGIAGATVHPVRTASSRWSPSVPSPSVQRRYERGQP